MILGISFFLRILFEKFVCRPMKGISYLKSSVPGHFKVNPGKT